MPDLHRVVVCATHPSFVFYALIMFGCANISFEVGQVLQPMLPDIVSRENRSVIRLGVGLGAYGWIGVFSNNTYLFSAAGSPTFGLNPRDQRSAHSRPRGCSLVYLVLFAAFLCIPDPKPRSSRRFLAAFAGIKALISTIRTVRRHKNIAWFLCARIFYVDGINTMFAFGAVYASGTFGMSTEEVVLFAIAII